MDKQIDSVDYEFDDFRADVLRRQLSRGQLPLPLTSKAFETLLLLIRRRGETVSKFELMNSIWGDTAVEENNLTQQISTLRRVLGERAGDRKFIVTVPGKGYSFVAAIQEISAHSKEGRAEKSKAFSRPPLFDRSALRGASFAFAYIFVIALSFLWSFGAGGAGRRPQSFAVLQFRTSSGNEFLGAGISDTLRARLGSVEDLILRPDMTNRDQDVIAAGRDLHVDAVVTGSVQRDNERVRVAVEMLDIADGRIVWGKTFDGNFSNVFELQDSIAKEVARVLRIKFSAIGRGSLQG